MDVTEVIGMEKKNKNLGISQEVPFLMYRKFLRNPYTLKNSLCSTYAHSREVEGITKRPRSARECAKAHSFLHLLL